MIFDPNEQQNTYQQILVYSNAVDSINIVLQ